jgi:hypothetical protein
VIQQDLYAPADLASLAVAVLGGIDLDPASDRTGRSLIPATTIYTREEDGLAQPWAGRVWLFPPHDGRIAAWTAKLIHEYRCGRTTAALLYTGLDARAPWWQHLAREAVIGFPAGAIRADLADGSPLPRTRLAAILAYLGPEPQRFIAAADALGAVLGPTR